MNNNLLKINGEFVKFVVTADDNVPNILKNSGVITIVHDKNVTEDNPENKVNRNKMYIADEFIASGYGVRDEDAARKLQSISADYDNTYSYFLNAYSYATNYSTDLYNRIVNFYVSNVGETSNTYIMLDDCAVTLSDIRKLFVPAQYDDFKINNTSYAQFTYTLNNFYINSNSVTAYSNEYLSDKQYNLSDLTFNIPVGAHLTKFTTYFDLDVNNHSGIDGVHSYFYTTKNSEVPDELQICEMHKVDLPEINKQYVNITQRLSTIYSGQNHNYIVNYGDNKPIENYEIHDAGSHFEKNYPLLEEDGKNIISTENFIHPYYLNFGDIHVSGNHMIYYYQQKYNANSTKFVKNLYSGLYSDTVDFTQIINNETTIHYKASESKQIILFALPACYDIEYVYYYDEYFHENCTGDVYLGYTKNGSVKSDFYLTVTDYNDANTVTKIKYNIYKFEFRTNAYKKDLSIHMRLMMRDEETTLQIAKTSLITDVSYTSVYTHNFVQNELYNTMHWFTPVDLSYLHF